MSWMKWRKRRKRQKGADKDPRVGDVPGVRVEPMRLTAGSRDAHRVTEPCWVHAFRVSDISTDQRQTQHWLCVLLRPVADQLPVSDDAVALRPAQHAFVIEIAGKLDVLETWHATSSLQLLLHTRSTTSSNNQSRSHRYIAARGPFWTSAWAVLDVAVGRFWPSRGPFWTRTMGRFGSWAVSWRPSFAKYWQYVYSAHYKSLVNELYKLTLCLLAYLLTYDRLSAVFHRATPFQCHSFRVYFDWQTDWSGDQMTQHRSNTNKRANKAEGDNNSSKSTVQYKTK